MQPLRGRIRYGINRSGLAKCPQSKDAALADAAGFGLTGIARPTYMERCAQFNSQPDDLAFAHCDQRGFDPNLPVLGAHLDELIECVIVGGPAVRIPRTVLLYCPDKHRLRAQHLRPAYRRRKEMSIAERN